MEEENNDAFKDLFSGMNDLSGATGANPALIVKKMLKKQENLMKTAFYSGSAEAREERKKNLKQLCSLLIYLEKENLISFSKLTSSFSKGNENNEISVYVLEHKINIQNPLPESDNLSTVNVEIIGIEYEKQSNAETYPYFIWVYCVPSEPNLEKYGGIDQHIPIIIISVNIGSLPDDYIKQIYKELLKLLKK